MSDLIIVSSNEGDILFEVDSSMGQARRGGVGATGASPSGPPLVTKASASLEDALAQIGRIASAVKSALSTTEVEEAEVSLGVKVTGEGQFIVAKASAEASVTVTFKLKRKA